MGIAFPALTSVYNGLTKTPYSSIMNTIFEVDKLAQPFFSLALSRDESNAANGGALIIGSLPNDADPSVNISSDYVSTPIQHYPDTSDYSFYVITPDAVDFGTKTTSAGGVQYVVDSGSDAIYLSAEDAAAFASQFEPPASSSGGMFVVDCDATPPSLAVVISGQTFPIKPTDLILRGEGDTCVSAVQPSDQASMGTLGDPFLKNVVAVFDWGNLEMR